jgi:hypothetical protein
VTIRRADNLLRRLPHCLAESLVFAIPHQSARVYLIPQVVDCSNCSKEQKRKCREEDLYSQCPKAKHFVSLNQRIGDGDGKATELWEVIADDSAIDLDAWLELDPAVLFAKETRCHTFSLSLSNRQTRTSWKKSLFPLK